MSNAHLLGLVIPAISLIFSATFLVLWSRDRTNRAVLAVALAYAFMATGFLFTHVFGDHRLGWLILVNHALNSVGTTLIVWGACRRIEARISVVLFAGLAVVSGTIAMWATLATGALNVELLTVNF